MRHGRHAEYEAIEAAWRHVSSSHDFDATVVAKDEAGKVQIVRRHDEPTRHGAATGLGWGLAARPRRRCVRHGRHAEYEAIEAAWRHVSSSHDFDATVVAQDEAGKVQIVRRHDEPTRHGAATGLGWGLAAGAVATLFPAVGILGALAAGGGAGAALGAVAGHASGAMSRDDLKALGEVLDRGDAGLVVVYAQEIAGRVSTSVTAASSTVHATAGITGEQLAADVRAAEERAAAATGDT